MNHGYQAEFEDKSTSRNREGQLEDKAPWIRSLIARFRQERPVLLVALLIALIVWLQAQTSGSCSVFCC